MNRFMNMYKQKLFNDNYFVGRYFSSGWVKEVFYHPISTASQIAILSNRVTPSMRLSMPAYQVWVAVRKTTEEEPGGSIYAAYCTCTAG